MPETVAERLKKALGADYVREGNLVTPLIGGAVAFKAMFDAMQTAKRRGHYIYLLGWWLDLDISLTGEDQSKTPKNTMVNLLTEAANRSVQVRVMLWDQPGLANSIEVNRINALGLITKDGRSVDRLSDRDAAAIRDNLTLPPIILSDELVAALRTFPPPSPVSYDINRLTTGSHHQKVMLVRGEQGLIAFCGGVDINQDRVRAVGSGSPQHDVHCQIQGPAAHDLVDVFLKRWQAHPDHTEIDEIRVPMGLSDRSPLGRPKKGNQFVRIARNFNFINDDRSVVCSGERSIEQVMIAAIRQSSKFIYIEDQYLAHSKAAQALRDQLPKLQHVTIVVPHPSIEPVFPWRRNEFLRVLGYEYGKVGKVRVFYRFTKGQERFGPLSYIHSKTWVFDDELAVIGSANCNNRGWGYDSEVIAAIFDVAPDIPAVSFAQKLRMKLWALHLGVSEQDVVLGHAPDAMKLWEKLPDTAAVSPYYVDPDFDYRATLLWKILDPRDAGSWWVVDPAADKVQACGQRPTAAR